MAPPSRNCWTTWATSRCCSAPRLAACCQPASARAAADAYRELRRVQHLARLDDQPTQFEPDTMAAHSTPVLALWRAVFG
jgi:hypothetical protein